MAEWIDAKVQRPPLNHEVLVYVEMSQNHWYDQKFYAIDAWVDFMDQETWRVEILGYGNVLYWIELPDAPK